MASAVAEGAEAAAQIASAPARLQRAAASCSRSYTAFRCDQMVRVRNSVSNVLLTRFAWMEAAVQATIGRRAFALTLSRVTDLCSMQRLNVEQQVAVFVVFGCSAAF